MVPRLTNKAVGGSLESKIHFLVDNGAPVDSELVERIMKLGNLEELAVAWLQARLSPINQRPPWNETAGLPRLSLDGGSTTNVPE